LNESGVSSELALETSGHGALKENYFLDDGAYQIAKILVKLAQLHHTQAGTIDTLIESLQEPAEALEIRPKIKVADFSAYADQVLEAFVDYVEAQEDWERTPDNFEGVHVTVPNGWILVRKSLHDPQMPINIESNLEGGATALKQQVVAFLAAFDALEF
jgi:phosphomannomutase